MPIALKVAIMAGSEKLLAEDGGDDATRATVVAELAKVYALPYAQIEASFRYGKGERRTYDYGFGMGWHIVRAFVCMQVERRVFGYEAVEYGGEVAPHVRVGVFVEGQCSRGVLYQQMQQPCTGQRWQLPQDFGGYKVDAARIGAQSDMGLFYHDY